MNSVGVLLFCIQACFVHNVVSQCLGGPNYGYGPGIAGTGFAPGLIGAPAGPYAGPGYAGYGGYNAPGVPAAQAASLGSYGGSGTGDIAVIGELPVAGTTVVTGQVPIIGAVQFAGPVPAAGAVTISGYCTCGCNAGYPY